MSADLLASIFEDHRYLARGTSALHAALAAVPELAEGVPALVSDGDGIHVWSACGEVLRPMVDAVVTEALLSDVVEPPSVLESRLAEDGLVSALVSLSREGMHVSVGAGVVPFLQAAVLSAEAVRQQAPDASPGALARTATALLARLGAAAARLDATGVRIPLLVEAIATCRLLPIFPRGTLDRELDLPMLCEILGCPAPAELIRAGVRVIGQVVEVVMGHRTGDSLRPQDHQLLLRMLPPVVLDEGPSAAVASLTYDPDAWAVILPNLAAWLDAAGVQDAGLEPDAAERFLEPASGVALASAVGEALRELRRWDVLSILGHAVVTPPVGYRGLVAPRGTSGWGTAVACGLGRLRADAGGTGADAGMALDAAWGALARGVAGAVADVGTAGVVVFEDAADAVGFALTLEDRLGARVAVGVGQGTVLGGVDGRDARMYGIAVETALRWVAVAPLPEDMRVEDGAVLAHVGGWLCGTGVAIDAAVAQALEATLSRRAIPRDMMDIAANPRAPRGLDVHKVLACDDTHVIVLLRIPGASGGFEALRFVGERWRSLTEEDGTEIRAESPMAPPRPARAAPTRAEARSITPAVPGSYEPTTHAPLDFDPIPAPEDDEDDADGPTSLQPLFFLPGARGPEPVALEEDDAWDMPEAKSHGTPSRPSNPSVDVRYLLQGYATLQDAGRIWFGRPVAGRYVDLHSYFFDGDLDAAYEAFLKEKLEAGFTPRLERSAQIPAGASSVPLEQERLGNTWRRVSTTAG
jgi:hypothetical protein